MRPNTEGDIAGFDLLRNEDQKRLRERIGSTGGATVVVAGGSGAAKKKGKKRAGDDVTDGATAGEICMTGAALNDFGIEYAASSRSTCAGCDQKIQKAVVRVKKVVYDTEIGMKFGL